MDLRAEAVQVKDFEGSERHDRRPPRASCLCDLSMSLIALSVPVMSYLYLYVCERVSTKS